MSDRPYSPRRLAHRTWGQRLLLALLGSITLLCVLAASAVAYAFLRYGDLQHIPDLLLDKVPPGDPVNYLVVGSDSRSTVDPDDPDAGAFLNGDVAGGQRTDTIMVVRVDPRQGTIKLLSLPRDLWVPIADQGDEQRINVAYARGQQILIDTITYNFGISINAYIEVDFAGFKEFVDAIGGVPMYFDLPLRDINSGLSIPEAGCVTLNGEQALALARSRHLQYKNSTGWHTDPSADLGRISRQQLFIREAMTKALGTNILDRLELLPVAHENVLTDEATDQGDLKNLADQFKQFSTNNFETYSLPVENFETNGGASVVRLLEAPARPILNIFRGLAVDAIGEGDVAVDVLNGTGEPGRAHAVADAIGSIGFAVGTTGNAAENVAQTEVHFAPGDVAAGDLVLRHLTSGALLFEDENLEPGTVQLVVGPDFTTVMRQPFVATTTTTLVTTTTAPTSSGVSDDASSTTTSSIVGYVPADPPPGVTC